MSWPRYRFCRGDSSLKLPKKLALAQRAVRRLGPAAWFPFGVGITSAAGAVSQWDDQSGNGRHLKQATATNQPTLEADGSITFDGVDNFLKCDAFTLDQPETVYLLFKQITWTSTERIFSGNALSSGDLVQLTSTPQIGLFAGTATSLVSMTLDAYGVIAGVFNGASSSIQLNSGTPATGNCGAANMGGFTLGASGAPGGWANIQVKEVIIFAAAHDSTQRAAVIKYLMRLGGL